MYFWKVKWVYFFKKKGIMGNWEVERGYGVYLVIKDVLIVVFVLLMWYVGTWALFITQQQKNKQNPAIQTIKDVGQKNKCHFTITKN